jgi:hypothetical protein
MARITSFEGLGCLVTGASSGIGRDLALLLAEESARLVLLARREERLRELAEACTRRGAQVAYVLPCDLAGPEAPAWAAEMATNHLGAVDVLVNNAGFSVPGVFPRTDRKRLLAMLQVNVVAAVELAHRLLPGMIARDRGGVLNVASMAGYQPAPYTSAYGATKAFLLNWSDGVHQELKHTNVAVTALCPGVTDTEFFEAAGYRNLTGFLNRRAPCLPVARAGLEALRRGRMEVLPGWTNRLAVFAERFLPRRLVAAISARMMGGRRPTIRDRGAP